MNDLNLVHAKAYHDEWRYNIDNIKNMDPLENDVIVIVPEQYTVQAERDLISLLNSNGLFNITVLSFKRLVSRYLLDKKPLSDLGMKLLSANIMFKVKDDLKFFKSQKSINLGLIDNIHLVLNEFRENFINPEHLELIYNNLNSKEGAICDKLHDIDLIYSNYSSSLDGEIYDESRFMEDFIIGIESGEICIPAHFVVEGFSKFSGVQMKILAALMKNAKSFNIRITNSGIKDNYISPIASYTDKFSAQIIKNFTQAFYNVNIIVPKASELPIHAAVFESIFALKPVKYNSEQISSKFEIMECENINQELRSALIDIIGDVSQGSGSWSDYAILTNELSEIEDLAKRVCDDFGVPYFIDTTRSALSHYLIDYILSSLRAVISNFKGSEVLKLLKNKLSQIDYDSVCKIENVVIENAINYNRWLRIGDYIEELDENSTEKLSEIIERLKILREGIFAKTNNKKRIDSLNEYLEYFGVFDKIEADVKFARENSDFEYAEELSQIYNIIQDVLFQICAVESDKMSVNEFFELLKYGFNSYKIGIIPPNNNHIMIGDFKRSRISNVKKLFCIAMNEGVIPKKYESQGIFNADELELLKQYGIESTTGVDYKYTLEVFKLYENMLKTSGKVVWSYSKRNLDNDELNPSLWVIQAKNLGVAVKNPCISRAIYRELGILKPYFDSIISDLNADNALDEIDYSYIKSILDTGAGQRYKMYFEGIKYEVGAKIDSELLKRIDSEMSGRTLGYEPKKIYTSVSRLEKFAKCPYMHFVDYTLKPSIRKMPDIDAIDIGILFHDIFERVMNDISDKFNDSDFDDEELNLAMNAAFDAAVEGKKIFDLSQKNTFYKERLKITVFQSVKYAIMQLSNTEFKNAFNELSFGFPDEDGNAPNEFKIKSSAGKDVYFRGKIDRIDIARVDEKDYIRIIDYKSGSIKFDMNDVKNGVSLQLLLYLDEVIKNSDSIFSNSGDVEYLGAFYFKIADNIANIDSISDIEKVETSLIDSYALEGIMLNDVELYRRIDNTFDGKTSKVLKTKADKTGSQLVNTANVKVMSNEELVKLLSEVKKKAGELIDDIHDNKITITPYKSSGRYACEYCNFKNICKVDN